MILKNKRGDEVLTLYWFAIITIFAGGIFGMVYLFYGAPYDIRQIESTLIMNKVADCVSYAGQINSNLISNGVILVNNNFLESCHLIFNSSEWTDEQYYSEVIFYNLSDLNKPIIDIKKGNNNLLSFCLIQGKFTAGGGNYGGVTSETNTNTLPYCNLKEFYSVDNSNNQYIIKILSVVEKTNKNVKM